MAKLDLNARRAARSEAENQPHEVTLGFDPDGKPWVFLLKPRMPIEYMDLLIANQLSEALRILLVDPDQWEQFRMGSPDNEDLEAITALYSMSPPESDGSPGFSTNGGPTSNATSLPATDLISARSAVDRALSESAGSSPSSVASRRSPGPRGRSTGRRGTTGPSSQP
jgi:hypothetical protein